MIALFVESSLSCYRSRIPRSKALIAVIASLDKQQKRILTDNEKAVKATRAAVLWNANALILLNDIDGVYDKNP